MPKSKPESKPRSKPKSKSKPTRKVEKPRCVLAILTNRFLPGSRPRYFELVCESDGRILRERRLEKAPVKPVYDEVWENDEGRTDLDSCHRIKRQYRHRLLKQA